MTGKDIVMKNAHQAYRSKSEHAYGEDEQQPAEYLGSHSRLRRGMIGPAPIIGRRVTHQFDFSICARKRREPGPRSAGRPLSFMSTLQRRPDTSQLLSRSVHDCGTDAPFDFIFQADARGPLPTLRAPLTPGNRTDRETRPNKFNCSIFVWYTVCWRFLHGFFKSEGGRTNEHR